LLNAIGGLDTINKGHIFINNDRITGRTAGKIDKIRNASIGYIFHLSSSTVDLMSKRRSIMPQEVIAKIESIKDQLHLLRGHL
jgi:ABC-type lipoprotein export system ATPase subunit